MPAIGRKWAGSALFSGGILAEVEDVLYRADIRNYFKSLTDEIVDAFILRLRSTQGSSAKSLRNLGFVDICGSDFDIELKSA